MKSTILSGVLMLAASVVAHAQAPAAAVTPAVPAATPELSPEAIKSNTSYGFGYQNGQQFNQAMSRYGIVMADISSDEFLKGFISAMEGKKPERSEGELQAAMQALQSMVEKREKATGEKNLADGKAFLAENGKREGVTTTKSGLQYEVMTKGGDKKFVPSAKEEDDANKQFLVNYRGTLKDGTEFDKSPEGQPVPMTLQVVPGFKEAITTMPIGAKWKLFIPSDLAYGETRRSAQIAPNSVLVFELELVDIKDAPPQPQGGFPMPEMPQGR
jgi:FKBP-type peptidyl-prolyl cis-trans isomerase